MLILGIAPKWDEATNHSYSWFYDLYKEVRKLGYGRWILLLQEDATRSNVEKFLKEERIDLIIFYDHGTEEGLVAQDGHEYCLDKRNLHLVAGKTIYTLACLSGKDYGVEAYSKYDCVFWGYEKEFGFTVGEDEHLFKECANHGLIYKLKHNSSWREAYQKTIEKFNEAIRKAKSLWSKMWLRHDRDALVCYSKDMPPPKPKCLLRRLAIRLFGRVGRKISRKYALALLLFGIGYGLTWHDLWSEIISPVGNPYRIHGGYIGLALILIAFIISTWEYVRWLLRFR